APAVGIGFDLFDNHVDLVDRAPVKGAPITPLSSINPAKVAIGIGPLVPDGYLVLVQIFHVRVAIQKPEKFKDDRFEVEFFGREQRETICQRKPGLCSENRVGASTRAVRFILPLLKNQAQQLEILNHNIPTLLNRTQALSNFKKNVFAP